jgi:mannose/fructose/N-acetylgalactosamine-specific phosphotransferase system component IID
MEAVSIISVIFGASLLGLMVIGGVILLAIKIIKGGVSQSHRAKNAAETKMIQEIHQGLSRMEARVESLETILMDRERSGKEGA